ncbi:hypothetical protein V6N12_047908 [Hibiscus sabdariffa]|uniref:Uncharacterized protein n=1 Tax=Hibiscus sabdariffa TaxID=183260 RepID=A0ABR2CUC9_9ROSI
MSSFESGSTKFPRPYDILEVSASATMFLQTHRSGWSSPGQPKLVVAVPLPTRHVCGRNWRRRRWHCGRKSK